MIYLSIWLGCEDVIGIIFSSAISPFSHPEIMTFHLCKGLMPERSRPVVDLRADTYSQGHPHGGWFQGDSSTPIPALMVTVTDKFGSKTALQLPPS